MKKSSWYYLLISLCTVSVIEIFQSCLKEADLPTLTTVEVSNIKTQSALLGGNVTDDGGAKVDLRGFCMGSADNPSVSTSETYYCKGGTGNFNRNIYNLTPDTYYHVRAFALNDAGTSYGNEVHFRTKQIITPGVTTSADSLSASFTSIAVGGNIAVFDETPILERGFCLSVRSNPSTTNTVIPCGTGPGRFIKILDQLQPGTHYYMRAYAITIAGITFGNEVQFDSQPFPEIKVSEITSSYVRVEGKLKSNGRYGNSEFFDLIGICYDTSPVPTIKGHNVEMDYIDNEGTLSCSLTDLNPGTLYYIRIFVETLDWYNESYSFIVYGKEITLRTDQ